MACFRKLCALAVVTVLLLSACTSAPAGTPTEEPNIAPSALEILQRGSEKMVALESAHFTMTDEGDTSAKFFGMTFKSMEGQISLPDSFRVSVEAETSLGFFEVNIVAAQGQSFMRDIFVKDKWNPIPFDDLPFNFANLGLTLSSIIPAIQGPVVAAVEEVGGESSWRIEGVVPSETLRTLVTGANEGFQVGLQLWIGQDQYLLRKISIQGQVFEQDTVGVVRVISIDRFDEPVEIVLPETSAQ